MKSIMNCLRRWLVVRMMTAFSVFKTAAKFLMIDASDPGIPTVAPSMSFTSMSQRIKPLNQFAILSLGQMSALMKSKNSVRTIQKTKLVAERLRFFTCQINGGILIIIVMQASTGNAMAAGERVKPWLSMASDMQMIFDLGMTRRTVYAGRKSEIYVRLERR